MKAAVDAAYEEGRSSSFGDEELLALIYNLAPGRVREFDRFGLQ